jgi:hypothetical protein
MPSRPPFGRSCGRSPSRHGSIGDVTPLRVSLGVLGVVVAFALAGLVLEENWAGALAGLASGVPRPGHQLRPVLTDMASAGLLLSTVHWLAVRYAPRLCRIRAGSTPITRPGTSRGAFADSGEPR